MIGYLYLSHDHITETNKQRVGNQSKITHYKNNGKKQGIRLSTWSKKLKELDMKVW